MSELARWRWRNFFRPYELGNTLVSYYAWGAAIALGLDFTLRHTVPR